MEKSGQMMTSKSIIFRADLFFIALIMVMNYLTIEMKLISKKKVSAFATFSPRKGVPKRFLLFDDWCIFNTSKIGKPGSLNLNLTSIC